MVKLPSEEELVRMEANEGRANGAVSRELSEAARQVVELLKSVRPLQFQVEREASDSMWLRWLRDRYSPSEFDQSVTKGMTQTQIDACLLVLGATQRDLLNAVDQEGKLK